MLRLIHLFLVLFPIGLCAQVYTFPSTVAYFSKTTDFGTVHGYLPVVNDSGDSVLMRWTSRIESFCPEAWQFNFDDQNNFYGDVEHLDSADFYLYPPGTFDQKMIIGLAHNDSTGQGSIFFTLFPVNDRSDSTVIEFNFTISPGNDTSDTQGGPIDTTDTATMFLPVTLLADGPLNITWEEALSITFASSIDALVVQDATGRVLHESGAHGKHSDGITLYPTGKLAIIRARRGGAWLTYKVGRR